MQREQRARELPEAGVPLQVEHVEDMVSGAGLSWRAPRLSGRFDASMEVVETGELYAGVVMDSKYGGAVTTGSER